MRQLNLAIIQLACSHNTEANINQAEQHIRIAAAQGAQLILLPELFATLYFCQTQNPIHFNLAHPVESHPFLTRFAQLAAELGVVLPISFFERAHNAYYNSVMMIDADGRQLGMYRKTHIPDGAGYQEKFYFSPGDTGFKVWKTRYATVGVGICWDQWFPESARAMAVQGAEILLYPTAIGSEPTEPDIDSASHWQRVMQGHAGANLMPLAAANRFGQEVSASGHLDFYGTSFITDETGQIIAQAERDAATILYAQFDLDTIAQMRTYWGVFRDRRPSQYQPLFSLDGTTKAS